MEHLCEMCGNDMIPGGTICKYCGTRNNEALQPQRGPVHRVVNIEIGRPLLEAAIIKLERGLEQALLDKVAVLTVIHGYGSSGSGGVIRDECRKNLQYWKSIGKIKDFIVGEKFSKKEGVVRSLLRQYPKIASNDNLNRANKGVTLVVV